jgi:hypothetical protein
MRRVIWRDETKKLSPIRVIEVGECRARTNATRAHEWRQDMKQLPCRNTAVAELLAVVMSSPIYAQPSQSFSDTASAEPNFTPDDFKPAPRMIETRFGRLECPSGYLSL